MLTIILEHKPVALLQRPNALMAQSQTTRNALGTFTHVRAISVSTFVCSRCHKQKTSKTTIEWTTSEGAQNLLCNGCYGFLCSTVES